MVDDNNMGLIARRSVLEELGYEVHTCGSASEALDLCAKRSFDIVITDYKMPKMNGIEFIKGLRKLQNDLSIVLISGFADTLGLNEGNTGADIVLQKSNNEVTSLIRAVNRLMRKMPPRKSPSTAKPPKSQTRKSS